MLDKPSARVLSQGERRDGGRKSHLGVVPLESGPIDSLEVVGHIPADRSRMQSFRTLTAPTNRGDRVSRIGRLFGLGAAGGLFCLRYLAPYLMEGVLPSLKGERRV